MPERFDSAAGAAKSEGTPPAFTIEEGLSPLNAYFEFAPEDRTGVMAALWVATRHLPTANEYYAARQQGSAGEMRMEHKYGDLADAYAHSADPTFTDDQINGDSKTAANRRRFYGMVRTLTAEQVDAGVRRILAIEAKQKASPSDPSPIV